MTSIDEQIKANLEAITGSLAADAQQRYMAAPGFRYPLTVLGYRGMDVAPSVRFAQRENETKESFLRSARKGLKRAKCQAYAVISEAYITDIESDDPRVPALTSGEMAVSDLPPQDRIDAVVIDVEHKRNLGGLLTLKIVRNVPTGAVIDLEPMHSFYEGDGKKEGRMTGLLR